MVQLVWNFPAVGLPMEKCTSFPSISTRRFPLVSDQMRMTSCSSPRASVPVPPSARAAALEKPKRHRTRRLVWATTLPVDAVVKSIW